MSELLSGDETIIDPNKDYLSELVGPGKKYASEKDLAKAYYHADATIGIQNKRIDQFRSDFERERAQNLAREQLEEVMDRYSKAQLGEKPQEPEVKTPTFDPAQIESLVSSKIAENDLKKTQDQNFNLVKNKLMEAHGANYREAITKQINDLGMTGDEIDTMARTRPQVLIKALGLDAPKNQSTFQSPIRSTAQLPFAPTGTKERTWTYYQELKSKDPKAYRSEKIQNQMTADYVRLGPAFEDGNYKQSEY